MKPFERILVPVDFSEHSREALRIAADLGRRYESSLTLVHVFDPVLYALPDGSVLLTTPQLDRLIGELETHLEHAKREALDSGVSNVESRLLQGFVAGEIVQYAKNARIDLIVMGTHGRTGPKHLLLGSVAERVVRTAQCPVLTVKGIAGSATA